MLKSGPEEIARVVGRIRMKYAAQAMVRGGQSWDALFKRLGKTSSGTLETTEVKTLIRRILKVSKEDVSDRQLQMFVEEFDTDEKGDVHIDDFKTIMECDDIAEYVRSRSNRESRAQVGHQPEVLRADRGDRGPTRKELDEMRRCFHLFDNDDDDRLTQEEVGYFLQAIGLNPSTKAIGFHMHMVPSGGADFDTCVRIWSETKKHVHHAQDQQPLIRSFNVFDLHNTGYMSVAELKEVMTTLGEPLDEDEWEDLLERLPVDDEGKFNYLEAIQDRVFDSDAGFVTKMTTTRTDASPR